MIYKYGQPWWNDTDSEKQKNSELNLSQCHFVHHTNLTWTDQGMNVGLQGERPVTNCTSHGTAKHVYYTEFKFPFLLLVSEECYWTPCSWSLFLQVQETTCKYLMYQTFM
jgi:hypothetical protein